MSTVRDFYNFLDEIAPFAAQEGWDNSGFLVGDGSRRAEKVLVALDATEPVLDEACRIGAELIITHHPVIFGSLKELHPENIAFLAAERGVAVISSHTSLDIADGGVHERKPVRVADRLARRGNITAGIEDESDIVLRHGGEQRVAVLVEALVVVVRVGIEKHRVLLSGKRTPHRKKVRCPCADQIQPKCLQAFHSPSLSTSVVM